MRAICGYGRNFLFSVVPKNKEQLWNRLSNVVYQSQDIFVFIFSRFLPIKYNFNKYLWLWEIFLNVFCDRY